MIDRTFFNNILYNIRSDGERLGKLNGEEHNIRNLHVGDTGFRMKIHKIFVEEVLKQLDKDRKDILKHLDDLENLLIKEIEGD